MESYARLEKIVFLRAGKDILIKSVHQAVPTYAMSVFKIPKGCCGDLSKLYARFWWGSSAESRKIHWMRWDKVCMPKELGD